MPVSYIACYRMYFIAVLCLATVEYIWLMFRDCGYTEANLIGIATCVMYASLLDPCVGGPSM